MSSLSSGGATPIVTVNITPRGHDPKYHHTRTPYNMSSLTFPSKMIASGKISFATDSAVKNSEDTIREHAERQISYEFNIPAVNLKFFKECIEKVKQMMDKLSIYSRLPLSTASLLRRLPSARSRPMDLSIDTDASTATIQIYLNLPIIGLLLLSQAMGSLRFNSDIEVDFNVAPGGLVSDIAGIKVDTNNDVLVFWDFTSLGVETKGSHVIFHI
ncbi:uncharacterized protein F5147DRAFT_770683 [Suillus discolor]|uniref:Uncharacterized protein n=1 Tax=Suillus discolor TaxID=1912936 RepID=A0A9P7JX26_9AGAM|nr:uncharacterized protein F5147DRAFT_770683 [Suillus discolor]KAG2113469.1 hypothetical protein F5147DRAFT_770683 [Suillus discolor]